MITSRASEYGMQVLVYLQERPTNGFTSIKEIAENRGLSPSYLAKVANQLVDQGLLTSQKGAGGGVRLAKLARDIKLIDVVAAIGGLEFLSGCLIGYPGCNDDVPCPIHKMWGPLREQIGAILSSRNIEDLVREMQATHGFSERVSVGNVKRNPEKSKRTQTKDGGRRR